MTDATSIDTTFTDANFTDMTPFLERHRRRSRWVFIVMLFASLAVSVVSLTYAVFRVGTPGVDLWVPMAFFPLFVLVFWILVVRFARSPEPPDGRHLMSADDARGVTRVANAGFTFVAGIGVVIVASQAFWALGRLDLLQSLAKSDWIARVVLAANGALAIYLGNTLPKYPVARAPEQLPAVRMKINRLTGWLYVIFGALFAVAALFQPSSLLVPVVAALVITVIVVCAVGVVMHRRTLKSRKPS
jgi:hypothetical protein